MGVGPRACSKRKISGVLRKYKKGVDHRKGGCARKGGYKVVPSYVAIHNWILSVVELGSVRGSIS